MDKIEEANVAASSSCLSSISFIKALLVENT